MISTASKPSASSSRSASNSHCIVLCSSSPFLCGRAGGADLCPADDTPEQQGRFRRQKFLAALDWAEQERLISTGEINEVSYLWLARPNEEEQEPD
jgi:hypothetical protein